ncbi:MAG: NUDIX hydrolase [Alphaproteobacteria bacterium]|nr:NUDIX hydrolase [Alphaproteobacteria bacterium]
MTDYRNPTPTVDVLIEVHHDGAPGIVLIRRLNPPHGWALPGGFVDEGETVEAAAVREAAEETGLDVTLDQLLYVYSDPARDRRRHTMSVVFTGHAVGVPTAMDDAADARIFRLDELSALAAGDAGPDGLCMAFDHGRILSDYLRFRQTGRRPRPDRPGGGPG